MLEKKFTSHFKKDLKSVKRRNLNLDLLIDVIDILAEGKKLPEKNKDHELIGNWNGHRECHISDWLLI